MTTNYLYEYYWVWVVGLISLLLESATLWEVSHSSYCSDLNSIQRNYWPMHASCVSHPQNLKNWLHFSSFPVASCATHLNHRASSLLFWHCYSLHLPVWISLRMTLKYCFVGRNDAARPECDFACRDWYFYLSPSFRVRVSVISTCSTEFAYLTQQANVIFAFLRLKILPIAKMSKLK